MIFIWEAFCPGRTEIIYLQIILHTHKINEKTPFKNKGGKIYRHCIERE